MVTYLCTSALPGPSGPGICQDLQTFFIVNTPRTLCPGIQSTALLLLLGVWFGGEVSRTSFILTSSPPLLSYTKYTT